MQTRRNRGRKVMVLVAGVLAGIMGISAVAWACTNHQGTPYFCLAGSTSRCAFNGGLGNYAGAGTARGAGVTFIGGAPYTFQYSATTEDCHDTDNATFLYGVTTDGSGSYITSSDITMPNPGTYNGCAGLDGEPDYWSYHMTFTVTS